MRPQQPALTRALFSLFLFGGGASGCLLFTETFNRPPLVTINGPAALYRQEKGEFVATVDDDNKSGMKISWARAATCPTNVEAATRMVSATTGMPQSSDPSRLSWFEKEVGELCVVALVTDKQGAQGFAGKSLTIKGRQLEIAGPMRARAEEDISFTATFLDQADAVAKAQISWGLAEGRNACDTAKTKAMSEPAERDRTIFLKSPRRLFCVAVNAIDEFGAVTTATREVMVDFEPKVHMLQPMPETTKVGLFASVKLSAFAADDVIASSQTYAWTVVRPDGSNLTEHGCGTVATTASSRYEICFEAKDLGEYQIGLSVTNEDGVTKPAPAFKFTVEDRPPCIRKTEPNFLTSRKVSHDSDKPRPFRVIEVEDDADPQPESGGRRSEGRFVWSVRKVDDMHFLRRPLETFQDLTLDESDGFKPGDVVEVRVRYEDRIDKVQPRPDYASRCPDTESACELEPASGCYHWVTWTVVYQ
jgi:hypothetical protein